jgi:hypothetical protein
MFPVTHLRRSVYACITSAVLVAPLSACFSYQASPPHPLSAAEAKHPVRVTQRNGTEVTLREPRVSGDTLFGNSGAGVVAIPFSAIYTVSARDKDEAKTVGLISVVALVAGLVVVGLAYQ